MSSLVEAKNMYLRKLYQILSPEIYSGFKTMFKNVEDYCKENNLKQVISYFQKELEKIPKWSRDRITEETMKVQSSSECDYLLDIITALLMVNMKILVNNESATIDLQIPQLYMFIHKCYSIIGRELWTNPELVLSKGTSTERQKNYNLLMKIIYQGINDTIQYFIPMKPILNQYLHSNFQHEENDNDIISNSNSDLEISSEEEHDEDQDQEVEEEPENNKNNSTFFDDADDISLDE